jgi:hypothetical protein
MLKPSWEQRAWTAAAQEQKANEGTTIVGSFQEFSGLISTHSPLDVTVETRITIDPFKVPVEAENSMYFRLSDGTKVVFTDRYRDKDGKTVSLKGLSGSELRDRIAQYKLSGMNRTLAIQLKHPAVLAVYKGDGPSVKTPEEFATQRQALLDREIAPLYT